MVETRLRSWTPSTKPPCISCGKPTNTATDTEYGILPFCYRCGDMKRENQKSCTHILYGKDFYTEIGEPKTKQQTPKEIVDEIRSKQIPVTVLDTVIRNQQILLIKKIMKHHKIAPSEILN